MHKIFSASVLLLTLISPCLASEVSTQINNELEKTKTTRGKKFNKGSLLAVPIPISNPTVGSGLQAAVLYLHPSKHDSPDSPNATSGLGGMYTNSDSWVAGIFHDNYLLDDRLRIRGALGQGDLNIDYFGSGEDPEFADDPISYNLTANIGFAQALGRLPYTENWFGGLRAVLMEATIVFDLDALLPGLPELEDNMNISNLGLIINYDTKDNNYYPTQGHFFELSISRDDESWGSDFNFSRFSANYNHYFPIGEKHVIAAKIYNAGVRGDAPFFLLPSLQMRGFSFGRFQDDAVLSGHLEWRHKFHPRWGFMLSAEVGSVGNNTHEAVTNSWVSSLGAGIRWQVSAQQPMHLGLDVGAGEGESAIYLNIGEKF